MVTVSFSPVGAPWLSVTCWPAAKPTSPPGARMVPPLATCWPISSTSPAVATMSPWLVTAPRPAPLSVSTPPFMKALSVMSSDEATNEPPTFTTPPLPMKTPFWFSRKTLPVDVSVPKMSDWPPPMTRFSVAPWPLAKLTLPPAPIEKVDQSITALVEVWLTVRLVPIGAPMVALPARTDPPVGRTGLAAADVAASAPSATNGGGKQQAERERRRHLPVSVAR